MQALKDFVELAVPLAPQVDVLFSQVMHGQQSTPHGVQQRSFLDVPHNGLYTAAEIKKYNPLVHTSTMTPALLQRLHELAYRAQAPVLPLRTLLAHGSFQLQRNFRQADILCAISQHVVDQANSRGKLKRLTVCALRFVTASHQ